MAQIKIELSAPPIDGMDIKFKAPCDCVEITGMLIEYPDGSQEFTFRDCHGNNVAGIGNLFSAGAYVKVIIDTERGFAYLQNADNNGYLNSAILGTYTQEAENLTGHGENGKFKATVSGTFSALNVNGVEHAVKCGADTSIDLIEGCWYTFILDGETVNFNAGGAGGGGLNFKIVGNPQPASPSENTIWLNTDVPITSNILSPAEPETPEEGMVWISTGTASTVAFNALKRNGIVVCPISAKQYTGGEWVNVTAQSYQGGEWKNWRIYLFNNGPVEGVGAEWKFRTDNTSVSSGSVGNTLVMHAGVCPGTVTNYGAELYLDAPWDCSNVSTLNIHFKSINATGDKGEFGLYVNDRSTGEKLVSFDNLHKTDWTLSVDISHLDTIQVQLRTNPWNSMGNTCDLEVDAIWMA